MAKTPVLGGIEVASTNAQIASPESVGQGDLLANIANLGDVVEDTAVLGATEGLRNKMSLATDAAVAATTDPAQEELGVVMAREDDQRLLDRIKRLQAGAATAGGSAKARLELELRTLTSELGNKYPGLRAEASAGALDFRRTDPEYAALALQDAASTTFQKAQADELAFIKDRAYGSVAGGTGLGMSVGDYVFGSPEFVEQFNYLDSLQANRNANNIMNESLNAQENMDARSIASTVSAQIKGQKSTVSMEIRESRAIIREVANAALDPTQPGATEMLVAWENGGKDEVLANIGNLMFTIEDYMGEFPTEQRDTTAFANVLSEKNEVMGALTMLQTAIVTEDFNLVKSWETYEAIREVEFQTEHPGLADVGRIMKNNKELMDILQDDFAQQGKIFINELSNSTRQGLTDVLSQIGAVAYTHKLPPNATEDEINEHTRAVRLQNPNIYGNGHVNSKGVQVNSTTLVQKAFDPSFLNMVSETGVSPQIAMERFVATGSATEAFLMSGKQPADAYEDHTDFLADPGILIAAAESNKSDQPNAVLTASNHYFSMLVKDMTRRNASYKAGNDLDIGNGVPLSSVYLVDETDIENGNIRIIVDPEKVAIAVPKDTTKTFTGALGLGGDLRPQKRAESIGRAEASRLSAALSKDLKKFANLTALRDGSLVADYEKAWFEGDFDEYFNLPQQDIGVLD